LKDALLTSLRLRAAAARDDEADAGDHRGDRAHIEGCAADGRGCTAHARVRCPFAAAVIAMTVDVRVVLDVDLELALEVGEAVIDVTDVHILSIAEERSLGLLAVCLAATREFGGAIVIAARVRPGLAARAADLRALCLAGRAWRHDLAVRVAASLARAFAVSGAGCLV